MTRLVSAEEARGLLEGAKIDDIEIVRHDNDGGEINWQIACRSGRSQVHLNSSDLEGARVKPIVRLLAAAPDLAATVIALSEERDHLRATLYREGYAPCSSAACNCGGWHR